MEAVGHQEGDELLKNQDIEMGASGGPAHRASRRGPGSGDEPDVVLDEDGQPTEVQINDKVDEIKQRDDDPNAEFQEMSFGEWMKDALWNNWSVFLYLGVAILFVIGLIPFTGFMYPALICGILLNLFTVYRMYKYGILELQYKRWLSNLANDVIRFEGQNDRYAKLIGLQEEQMEESRGQLEKRAEQLKEAQEINSSMKTQLEGMKGLQDQIKGVLGREEENLEAAISEVTEIFDSTQRILQQVEEGQRKQREMEERNLGMMSNMKLEALKGLLLDIEFDDAGAGFSQREFAKLDFHVEEELRPYWEQIVGNWDRQLARVKETDPNATALPLKTIRDLVNRVFEAWKLHEAGEDTTKGVLAPSGAVPGEDFG